MDSCNSDALLPGYSSLQIFFSVRGYKGLFLPRTGIATQATRHTGLYSNFHCPYIFTGGSQENNVRRKQAGSFCGNRLFNFLYPFTFFKAGDCIYGNMFYLLSLTVQCCSTTYNLCKLCSNRSLTCLVVRKF